MTPQFIWLLLVGISIGVSASRHGEGKSGYHNFWTDLLGFGLGAALLWWGGFFDPVLNRL